MSLYVTPSEFVAAPTGIDTNQLDVTNIGNNDAQTAVLRSILTRASAWVDTFVQQQTLEASVNTETKEVRVGRDGRMNVHVDMVPIVELQSVSVRFHPAMDFMSVDLKNVEVRDNWFTIYDIVYNTSSPQGLVGAWYGSGVYQNDIYTGFNSPYYRKTDMPITIQYTYLNGYANTTINSTPAAGAATFTVVDSTGMTVGQKLTIYDGFMSEVVYVQSVNGNNITITNPLAFSHNAGCSISAIPESVKQATIMLATALIKDRGALSVTLQETNIMGVSATPNNPYDEISIAKELLRPYRRVVIS